MKTYLIFLLKLKSNNVRCGKKGEKLEYMNFLKGKKFLM